MAVRFEQHDDIAILIASNPPVNALSAQIRKGLHDGIARAEAQGFKALLIYGEGRTWFAGADIREFGKPPITPILPDVCNAIEACAIPVIAAMHGTALGGGLEIALACHYRICATDAKMGLPEVGLGLLPGAGGTQRLPRLTGYDVAIDMITNGHPVSAAQAENFGIVDQTANGVPREFGLKFAQELIAAGRKPRPISDIPAPKAGNFSEARSSIAKKARGQLSPVVALEAIEASSRLPFFEGLAEERRLFKSLMETDQRKGLVHAFFSEREVTKLPELEGIPPRNYDNIGVIGGGTMGAGIATSALLAGLDVTLVEMTAEAAEAAKMRIVENLAGALKRGKISQSNHDAMLKSSLRVTSQIGNLDEADVIIEAVFENMAVKKQIFTQLEKITKPSAVLATNTSYLDINEIASSTTRKGDVIGLHFFSPAHVMRLLEVVVGDDTLPEVIAAGFELGKRLKKVSVRSGVCDGFIGNRILNSYRTAADHMILDGASPFQIDGVLEKFGFAMGPFAVADLAGLDIGYANRQRLAPMRHPRERVSTYADQLCEAGHLGQKTGCGYYIYEGRSKSENPEVLHLIDAERMKLGIAPRTFSDEEIRNRYMAAMVNEAAKVVGEGIARRPLDVDVVLLMGYGFPRFHGGPLKWADLQGLSSVLKNIQGFAKDDPYFWEPAPLLETLVRQSRTFEDLNHEAQS